MNDAIKKHLDNLKAERNVAFQQVILDEKNHARNRQALQDLNDIIDALDPPTRTNSNTGDVY